MGALKLWSDAVGSTKLADMLANPDALLKAVPLCGANAVTPGTAEKRLRWVEMALKADGVQQLLGGLQEQLPAVLQQLASAKKGYGKQARDQAAAASAAAETAAAAPAAEGLLDAPALAPVCVNMLGNVVMDEAAVEDAEAAATAAAAAAGMAATTEGEAQEMQTN
jgi:hypothetical protein